MSIFEPKKKFELVPEGTYDARLIWLIDLGTHRDEYEGVVSYKRKMHLGWELIGTTMEDGRPFMVGKSYTVTNGQYGPYIAKTSNLSKLLRAWQKVDEKTAGRMTYLGGLCHHQASAQITVAHEQNRKDPLKTNIVLETIKASKKELPAAVNPVMMYEVGQPYPENLPEWAKKMVEACLENNGGIPAKENMSDDPGPDMPVGGDIDESIPF